MIGIYHSRDLDGFTSGAIMKLKYPDIEKYGKITFKTGKEKKA